MCVCLNITEMKTGYEIGTKNFFAISNKKKLNKEFIKNKIIFVE